MFASLALVTISAAGVVYFLLGCCVVVLLVWGLRYLASLAGIAIPQPLWGLFGFVLVLLLILYALGVFGAGGGVTVR